MPTPDALAAGDRFTRLTVTDPAARLGKVRAADCICDCGTVVTVAVKNLRNAHTRSCGCLAREATSERRRSAGRAEVAPAVRQADTGAVRAAANERRAARRAEQRRVNLIVKAAETPPPPPDSIEAMLPDLMRIARQIAWKHYNRAPLALERDEMEGAALAGLAEALDRWPRYCEARGYQPDGPGLNFLAAYCARTVNGSVIDSLRRADFLTRHARERTKVLRQAGMDAGATEAELASRTGLKAPQIRDVRQRLAAAPVAYGDDIPELPDPGDTEGSALAASITGALVGAVRSMDQESQLVLVLAYYQEMDLDQVAEHTALPPGRVRELHDAGVIKVHRAMAEAAG